ncbi:MAG TPA: dihydrodipicolinate synthase family protein, partial [Draconibacterium sp.]|nr:dihydrodipicolinate synthase family protein [Draconibacterium sp.]
MIKIEGLIAAPFTPMDSRGNVMYSRIPEYFRFLEKNEIAGAFINGSTGEGVSLSQKEKAKITKTWVAQKTTS